MRSVECKVPLNPSPFPDIETTETIPNSQIPNYFSTQSIQQGWECPRCGQINAPWSSHCDCKRQTITTTTTTTIPVSNVKENMQQGWITYEPKPGWNSAINENAATYCICKEKE